MENNIKGITLNQQLVDLLSIIDDVESKEEQDARINKYISELAKRANGYSKMGEKYAVSYVIDSVCSKYPNTEISKIVMQVYSQKNNKDREVCDSNAVVSAIYEKLQNYGMSREYCENLNTSILKTLRETDFSAKPGILEMTPEDVRNLYNHILDSGYNRITMDTCGRYSDFVAIDGETFCYGNIERMMKFAKKHEIKTKINTFIMYSDFPNIYNDYLSSKIDKGEITEDERKNILKNSLMKYVIEIGSEYGDQISAVDIFNELIYNPGTSEKKEFFSEYQLDENGNKIQIGEDNEGKPIYKEAGFVERSQTGWQKYLNLDDLCEIAVVARAVLPDATFTYNDWNWVIPEKRQAMINMVNKIQEKQKTIAEKGGIQVNDEIKQILKDKGIDIFDENGLLKFGKDQTIIDDIGFEAHLNTETTPEQFEEAVDDVKRQTGLPVEVTEEDVAYEKDSSGDEGLRKEMQQKQLKLFEKINELVKKGKIIACTIWSLGKASFTDRMYGYTTHASKLDEKFESKTEKRKKEITFQEIGKGTARDFSSNPQTAITAIETLENGVRTQEAIKEGKFQGEE